MGRAVNSAIRLIFRILFQDDLQRFSQLKVVRVVLMQIVAHTDNLPRDSVQRAGMRWETFCPGSLEKDETMQEWQIQSGVNVDRKK